MPIVEADIHYHFSTTTGPGNSTVGAGATSLGEFMAITQLTSASLHDLFDLVTGTENAASEAEYRGILIHNQHATLSLIDPVVWLVSEVAGGTSLALSVDTTATSLLDSAVAQMKEIANENTAPATQTFSSPTTKATGLALSTIPAGFVKGVWIRRAAANTAALASDGGLFRVEGDTEA